MCLCTQMKNDRPVCKRTLRIRELGFWRKPCGDNSNNENRQFVGWFLVPAERRARTPWRNKTQRDVR